MRHRTQFGAHAQKTRGCAAMQMTSNCQSCCLDEYVLTRRDFRNLNVVRNLHHSDAGRACSVVTGSPFASTTFRPCQDSALVQAKLFSRRRTPQCWCVGCSIMTFSAPLRLGSTTKLCLLHGKAPLIAGCQVNENRAASALAGLAFGLQVLEAWQDQMLLAVGEQDGSKPRPVRIRCCSPFAAPRQ